MGNKHIKVNSSAAAAAAAADESVDEMPKSKSVQTITTTTTNTKKKTRPLSACFSIPSSITQNHQSNNNNNGKFIIKQSKSDYGIIKEMNLSGNENLAKKTATSLSSSTSPSATTTTVTRKSSLKSYLLSKLQNKKKRRNKGNNKTSLNSAESSKNLNESLNDSTLNNNLNVNVQNVVRSTTDYNLLNVTDNSSQMTICGEDQVVEEYDGNSEDAEAAFFKTRFVKSPALYNIQEIDNNNNILISDLMHRENSFDSISIINDSVNYFNESTVAMQPPQQPTKLFENNYKNDNLLLNNSSSDDRPELELLNEVNKKLTIYQTNLIEQSYFYYGNTTQFDLQSLKSKSFSVSSLFITSQAPLAASECTTLTTTSCNNLTTYDNNLEIFYDGVSDYININF